MGSATERPAKASGNTNRGYHQPRIAPRRTWQIFNRIAPPEIRTPALPDLPRGQSITQRPNYDRCDRIPQGPEHAPNPGDRLTWRQPRATKQHQPQSQPGSAQSPRNSSAGRSRYRPD